MKNKDINFVYRTLSELLMSFIMIYTIKKTDLIKKSYDGIIWYSPTIFFGFFINFLKKNLIVKHI